MKTLVLSFLLSFNLFAHYSQDTLDQIAHLIDDQCMDTFCGGDFNYYEPTLTYKNGLYTLTFNAEDWYEGEMLSESMNKSFPIMGDFQIGYWVEDENLLVGNYLLVNVESVELAPSYWEEKGLQPIAKFACIFEMKDNEMDEDDFAEAMYSLTLECVDGFEDLID